LNQLEEPVNNEVEAFKSMNNFQSNIQNNSDESALTMNEEGE
jgi:hypothetical protein